MTFEEFKEKFERKKVTESQYSSQLPENPVVSVIVMTYNHAAYIKDCLEGILMQETSFPFEILVGEDDSTDGTREICLGYAKKYPDKIRLLLHHRENNIKVNGHATGRFNSLYSYYLSRGKYIAMCEGDDYWTDPLKLQKQVEFMENNADCSLCYHKTKVTFADNSGHDYVYQLKGVEVPRKFSLKEFINGDGIAMSTLTTLFKADGLRNLPDWVYDTPFGDLPLKLICGFNGKFGYIPEIMAMHVKVSTPHSWSANRKTVQWALKSINAHFYTYDMFDRYARGQYHNAIQKVKEKILRERLSKVQKYGSRIDQLKVISKYLKYFLILEKPNKIVWLNFFLGHQAVARISSIKHSILSRG